MYLIGGIFLILFGLLRLLEPEAVYTLEERFRSSPPGEPSKYYLVCTRISGGIITVAGIAAIIMQFMG